VAASLTGLAYDGTPAPMAVTMALALTGSALVLRFMALPQPR